LGNNEAELKWLHQQLKKVFKSKKGKKIKLIEETEDTIPKICIKASSRELWINQK